MRDLAARETPWAGTAGARDIKSLYAFEMTEPASAIRPSAI